MSRPLRPSISPLPPHGTTARATGRPAQGVPGCPCKPCRAAKARYSKRRRVLNATGRNLRIPAQPVAAHVRVLFDSGMGWPGIARAAGCSTSTLHRLLAGQETIQRSAANRILAVRPKPAPGRYIDATGTRRRLQALMAIGHTLTAIAADAGTESTTLNDIVNGHQSSVRGITRDRIAATYRRISQTPGSYTPNRRRAAAQGWPDPTWWEDYGHIDDPAFDPAAVETSAASSRRDPLVADEIRHLASFGIAPGEIARRVGRSENYVKQIVNGWTAHARRQYEEAA
ncbi:hypothetical protein [Streptomyces sp. DH37]|uniref:hypothetical protein n=1 Tax=Streptomyces sp. DH37 TaxID=3040122 RepID=UPI00244261A5|nr:hypothetical protein [Streptomyces sp. DH37]MDG9701716.1 hypothetical protein [Streptomyces sp. DH37]